MGAVTIELKDGILVYHCKLVRYMTLRQNPILNEKFQGVSLEGKVLSVQNQEIKLHLDIDAEQDEDTAYWYPFVPPTTDMLYLMPQLGTNASLYIPRLKEQNAIITGCVRNNGGSCEKTGDPSTRYLGTEYGQEMRLAPGGIYFTAGRNDLILTFDDEEGVKISSHKEIVIEAKEEIIFDSKTKVMMNSPNLIRMTTPTGGFSMENEIHFADMKTIIECTDETELPLVDQKLMQKQSNVFNKPQKMEDAGIDWGGLMNAVLGVRVAEASPLEQGDVISSAPDDGTDETNKNQPGKDENGRTYQERVLEKANSSDATTWDKINGVLWSPSPKSTIMVGWAARFSMGLTSSFSAQYAKDTDGNSAIMISRTKVEDGGGFGSFTAKNLYSIDGLKKAKLSAGAGYTVGVFEGSISDWEGDGTVSGGSGFIGGVDYCKSGDLGGWNFSIGADSPEVHDEKTKTYKIDIFTADTDEDPLMMPGS